MREIVTNNPFIRISFPFIIGIIIGNTLNLSHPNIYLISFFILLIIFSTLLFTKNNYKVKYIQNLLIYSLFLLLGIYKFTTANTPSQTFNNVNIYYSQIISTPDTTKKNIKLKAKIYSTINKTSDIKIDKQANLYLKKNQKSKKLKAGEIIVFKGKLQKIQNKHNPYEFNYAKYAKSTNLYYTAFLSNTEWIKIHKTKNNLQKILSNIRTKIQDIYTRFGINKEQLAILNALSLGDKSQLTTKLKANFSRAGIMHVLAVSGLHVGIVYLLIISLISPLSKIKYGKGLVLTITMLGIWLYATITGLSPSVNRAATMFTILAIGKFLNRPYASYNSIALSAFILLYINPLIIYNLGFQLSFIAVTGIVYLYPLIYKLRYTKNKILNKIWQLTSISIAAQISTFPITIYYFHQFPLLFLISNILMIPLATIIIYSSILLLSIHSITIAAIYVGEFTNSLIKALNYSTDLMANLNWSSIHNIQITTFEMWILILIIFFTLNFLLKTRYKNLRNIIFLLITLSISIIYRNFVIEFSSQIIVYNTNNNSLTLIRQGRMYKTYPDKIQNKLTYFTNPLIQKFKLQKTPNTSSPIFSINNKLGLIVNNKYKYANKKLSIEWLILTKNAPKNIFFLIQKTLPKKIIFDTSVKRKQIVNWKKQLVNYKPEFYDVKKKGAFIINSSKLDAIFLQMPIQF